MLVGDHLKIAAQEILSEILPEIELNYHQSGTHEPEWLSSAPSSIERLSEFVSSPAPANPHWSGMAELAAELVYTSFHHQEAIKAMFADLDQAWPKDINVRTAVGINQLSTFVSLINDDHAYCLDPEDDAPLVKLEHQLGGDVGLMMPNSLLEAMRRNRRSIEDDPRVSPGA